MRTLVVIPAHNEAETLARVVERVVEACETSLAAHDWQMVIAENGSTDATYAVAESLAERWPGRVHAMHGQTPGKGAAIREAWLSHEADVYLFMDADLSADVSGLAALVDACAHADVAIGSRVHPSSRTERSLGRRVISRAYNILARLCLGLPYRDLQCGWKAISHRARTEVLPQVTHPHFFFDTELVACAHHAGLSITELPIRWSEQGVAERTTRVRIWRTSAQFVLDLFSLRQRLKRNVIN